jgi:signal transduction histidine kinase
MRERPVKQKNRKPRFLWQGVLILAPMLVLAKLGALAIWQDKRMAEHEANLRAQDLAEQVADRLSVMWPSLEPGGGTVGIATNGNLVQPKPLSPDWPMVEATLTREQSNLLSRARAAEFSGAGNIPAIELFQQFLASEPPVELAQSARYSLGLLFLANSDTTNATRTFRELIDHPAPARGETGADLRTLSLFKLATISASSFEDVCRSAVHEPTLLTPQVLRAVFAQSPREAKETAERWWMVWQAEELQRHLYAKMRPLFRGATNSFASLPKTSIEPPAWVWLDVPDEEPFVQNMDGSLTQPRGDVVSKGERWYTISRRDTSRFIERKDAEPGYALAIHLAPDLAEWANKMIKSARAPQYFGVSVSIGNYDVIRPEDLRSVIASGGGKGVGRIWVETNRGTNAAPVPLGTASRVNAGELPFVARVHLIGPDLLFEQQNSRSLWIRMVLVTAALTSIVGFISAYRAFHKQLRLSEMKSNFVSSVSHELRAPIASVRLMAEGLERGKISDPTKQREYFRFITQECRRLSSMIENVLDFARIEQGRKQYEFEPTNVTALVEQTVKVMGPYAAERNVQLVSRAERPEIPVERSETLQDSVLTASIDGPALQQALVNLIDNAIKHSPNGSEVVVALSVDVHRALLELSVSDSGPGIPGAEHEKIFERFYRLGSELRRETPGVGIGLSIVKHVVEAHGGEVRVKSEAGRGSRFTIEIPLKAETQKDGENA